MKFKLFSIFLLFFISVTVAQETEIEEDNTLNGQFNRIYRTSTTYQTYKVVSIKKYEELKKNVLDSLQKANRKIAEKEKELKFEKDKVNTLNIELEKTKTDLKTSLAKEDSIFILGIALSKTTYNLILWLIILGLILGLSFFAFKFSRSHVLTKKAQEDLEDVEQEFEMHRKKSLEREQKLRRQLQDEINKQRNS